MKRKLKIKEVIYNDDGKLVALKGTFNRKIEQTFKSVDEMCK